MDALTKILGRGIALAGVLLTVGGCPDRPVDDPEAPDYSAVCVEICDSLFECSEGGSYATHEECRADCGDTSTKLWGECGPQAETAFGCSAALTCEQLEAAKAEPEDHPCRAERDAWEACMGITTGEADS